MSTNIKKQSKKRRPESTSRTWVEKGTAEFWKIKAGRSQVWHDIANDAKHKCVVDVYCLFFYRWIALACLVEKRPEDSNVLEMLQSFISELCSSENKMMDAVLANRDMITRFVSSEHMDLIRYIGLPEDRRNIKSVESLIAFQNKIEAGNTEDVMLHIFQCLYLLRNRIFHGKERWDSEIARATVADGTKILEIFVPIFMRGMNKRVEQLFC